jgi:hypothetical protein
MVMTLMTVSARVANCLDREQTFLFLRNDGRELAALFYDQVYPKGFSSPTTTHFRSNSRASAERFTAIRKDGRQDSSGNSKSGRSL